jgi:magnesium-transporting ATPase (P-type)
MKEILEKISSYNIFNYLLPGALFGFWANNEYNLSMPSDILTNAFVYYFLGMIISRVGSLIIAPILKKLKITKFEDYKKFVKASKKDEKIDLLSEVNNMYRTIIALIVVVGFLKFYNWLEIKIHWLTNWNITIGLVFLLVLFILSYQKQTKFITKRIKANLDE